MYTLRVSSDNPTRVDSPMSLPDSVDQAVPGTIIDPLDKLLFQAAAQASDGEQLEQDDIALGLITCLMNFCMQSLHNHSRKLKRNFN